MNPMVEKIMIATRKGDMKVRHTLGSSSNPSKILGNFMIPNRKLM